MKRAILYIMIILLIPGTLLSQHEYTDVVEVDLAEVEDYAGQPESGKSVMIDRIPDFVLPDSLGHKVSFYEFLKAPDGTPKKLVLLTFMRADCDNTGYETPMVAELYRSYHGDGFDVLGVMEYSEPEYTREFLERYSPPFTILFGTKAKKDDAVRTSTLHYRLRKSLGDERKWGTPFSFLILDGDVEHVWYTGGEFREGALEDFILEKLYE